MSVLEQIALGRANKEIAVELHLASATVKNNITVILQKLQVKDRMQAVLRAHALGILSLPELAQRFSDTALARAARPE